MLTVITIMQHIIMTFNKIIWPLLYGLPTDDVGHPYSRGRFIAPSADLSALAGFSALQITIVKQHQQVYHSLNRGLARVTRSRVTQPSKKYLFVHNCCMCD